MQNAKDSFYVHCARGWRRINPERTILLRGAVRPGILVEEAEAPFGQLPNDVFVLRWLGLGADVDLTSTMAAEECEVIYQTCGTQSFGGLDRGRVLSAMDEELVAMLQPLTRRKMNYTTQPPVTMLTNIFWDEPCFYACHGAAGSIGPVREGPGVQLPRAGGIDGSRMVSSSRAGYTAGARVFCASESSDADAGALRCIGAGHIQPRRSAESLGGPGMDSGIRTQIDEQVRCGTDGNAGGGTGAGTRRLLRRKSISIF